MKRLPHFSTLCFIAVIVFLYAPLLVLMGNSFNKSKYGGTWEGFTWQWYERLWKDDATIEALLHSLEIGACATIGATILGTLAAWCLHRYSSPLQRAHLLLTELPLAVPDIWLGVAMPAVLRQCGLAAGLWHSDRRACDLLPVLRDGRHAGALAELRLSDHRRGSRPGRDELASRLACRAAGAGPWHHCQRVAGLHPVAGRCSVITFFVSGPGASTLPSRVFALAKTSRNLPVINALSTILTLGTFAIAILGHRLMKKA